MIVTRKETVVTFDITNVSKEEMYCIKEGLSILRAKMVELCAFHRYDYINELLEKLSNSI